MKRGGFFTLLVVGAFASSMFLGSPAAAKSRKKSRKAKPAVAAAVDFDPKLPVLGTRLAEFPAGPAKAVADEACLSCHSANMIWQQRLTEKQWTAEINKMIGWGADVPDAKKDALLAYLVANFGPDNEKFHPLATRPVGR